MNRKVKFEYYKVIYAKSGDRANTPDRSYGLNIWLNLILRT